MVSLWLFDVGAAVILAATALLGAYMPVVLARKGKATGERSLSFILGNMLSAGVMISAGFCHLLGDAIQQLTRSVKYPLAPFLCACGFMSTLIADQVVEAVHSRPPDIPVLAEGELQMLNTLASGGTTPSGSSPHGHHHCFGAAVQLVAAKAHRQHASSPRSGVTGNGGGSRDTEAGISFGDEEDGSDSSRLLSEQQKSQRSNHNGGHHQSGSEAELEARSEHALEVESGSRRPQVSFLTACLMAVALTFHSLLEGAALGAQPNVVNSMHIFIAIQAHKGLAAYALGSSIVDSAAPAYQFWSVIATFAFATPVGICVGLVLSSWTTSNGAAAISALASGTFIYVAFMEVLPRELSNPDHRLAKLSMLTLGFGLMSLLAIWA